MTRTKLLEKLERLLIITLLGLGMVGIILHGFELVPAYVRWISIGGWALAILLYLRQIRSAFRKGMNNRD
ncbi:MAG: hypothetical protein V3T31_03265 [candidate division Zixibacteria bacterium]